MVLPMHLWCGVLLCFSCPSFSSSSCIRYAQPSTHDSRILPTTTTTITTTVVHLLLLLLAPFFFFQMAWGWRGSSSPGPVTRRLVHRRAGARGGVPKRKRRK